jgi:hypothetical protein
MTWEGSLYTYKAGCPKNNVTATRISVLKLDLKTLCARVDCGTHMVSFGHLGIL